eukprot:Tbor_TRINITY_DN3227_c0_g1::TRINITY_DN3227_c0_g1_i1::g.23811::m.23811/K12827/SF3A3, SAP61, PRP9; splicing factor 3A subunit 3
MKSGILERIRSLEADIETATEEMVQEQLLSIKNPRHRILSDHILVQKRDKIIKPAAEKLLDLYLDEDDIMDAIAQDFNIDQSIREFSEKIASLREYFQDHPSVCEEIVATNDGNGRVSRTSKTSQRHDIIDSIEDDPELFLKSTFTSGEMYGTCLQCYHESFDDYNNFLRSCALRKIELVENEPYKVRNVVKFAANMPSAFNVSTELKVLSLDTYEYFVTKLLDYLVGFYERCKPLEKDTLKRQLGEGRDAMTRYWDNLLEATKSGSPLPPKPESYLPDKRWNIKFLLSLEKEQKDLEDCDDGQYENNNIISQAKGVAIKEALVCRLTNGLMAEICDKSDLLFRSEMTKQPGEIQREREQDDLDFQKSLKEMAERKAVALSDNLAHGARFDANKLLLDGGASVDTTAGSSISASYGSEKVNLLTAGMPSAVASVVSMVDKNGIPVDEDGNSLPLWQIKQRGLRKNFRCEICLGTIYKGPKTYFEHFPDERHTAGLLELGIRNTKEYDGVDTITGALELNDALGKGRSLLKRARYERENEEMQDHYGRIFLRKDFHRS